MNQIQAIPLLATAIGLILLLFLIWIWERVVTWATGAPPPPSGWMEVWADLQEGTFEARVDFYRSCIESPHVPKRDTDQMREDLIKEIQLTEIISPKP